MYRGGDLSDLFKQETTGPPTERALRSIADSGGAEMTKRTRAHTPVDTGRTRDSFEQVPVQKIVGGGYRSGTESHHYKARWLEHGTKAHRIEPKRGKGKRAISTPEGARASADHPGTVGHHMVARAAVEVEAGLDQIARPHLETWARDVEQNAKRNKGIT